MKCALCNLVPSSKFVLKNTLSMYRGEYFCFNCMHYHMPEVKDLVARLEHERWRNAVRECLEASGLI